MVPAGIVMQRAGRCGVDDLVGAVGWSVNRLQNIAIYHRTDFLSKSACRICIVGGSKAGE
jgi:hypothetical protein